MADARDVFYRERDAIAQALARGENPYGGYQNAVDSIYNTYGRDSGVSYQEVAGILSEAYPPAGTTPQGGGGGGDGGSQIDPNAIAAYDTAIQLAQSGLGSLDRQQDVGLSNLASSFAVGLNKLLDAAARGERDYTTNRERTTQENISAKSAIDTGTGQNANALARLLGLAGAGSSSAASFMAPYAAALLGTQQRGQVNRAFSQNMADLDVNIGDYRRQVEGSKEDLGRQRFSQEQALRGQVAGRRSDLLSQLANLTAQRAAAAGGSPSASVAAAQGYINQVRGLNDAIAGYGAQFAGPINVNTPTYAAPNLAAYNFDRATPTTGTSGAADSIAPYLSILLGRRKDQPQGLTSLTPA